MKLGTVAYFVLPHSRRTIGWGVVEENYVDGVGLELYEMPDFRLVHGIPIAKYDFNGKRKKATERMVLGHRPLWRDIQRHAEGI